MAAAPPTLYVDDYHVLEEVRSREHQHKQPIPFGDVVERGCTPPARSITTVILHQLSV